MLLHLCIENRLNSVSVNINSRVYYCFFKRSTCSLFHNVFPLRYGFSYCLYRVIYFLPIHLKCPSHSSVTCSCQVVLLCFPPVLDGISTGSFPLWGALSLGIPHAVGRRVIPVLSSVSFRGHRLWTGFTVNWSLASFTQLLLTT